MTYCEKTRPRPALYRETGDLYRVFTQSWHAAYDPILGAQRAAAKRPSAFMFGKVVEGAISSNKYHFAVAEAGGEIAGFAMSGPAAWMNRAFLGLLYVHPAHQRKGIGSRLLLDATEQHSACRAMRLHVLPGNAAARGFYERHGFHDVCTSFDLITRTRVLVMQKVLRGPVRHQHGVAALVLG